MEEIKVTEQTLNEVEAVTRSIDWTSIGKKGVIVAGVTVLTYLGVKYVVKPVAGKIFKKKDASDSDVIDVTADGECFSDDDLLDDEE